MKTKILQIIPAPAELYAVYKQKEGNFTNKLVCLALVETEECGDVWRKVVGMDWCEAEISSVESNANFSGYADSPIIKPTPPDPSTP